MIKYSHMDNVHLNLNEFIESSSTLEPPFHQIRVYPPSTRKSAPVMYLAESLSMKTTGPMISSGVPTLPAGINEIHLSRNSAFSSKILRVLEHDLAMGSLGRKYQHHSITHRGVKM